MARPVSMDFPARELPGLPPQGIPDRVIRLLREARWITLCFLAMFLLMVLISYHPEDPGWSQEVAVRTAANLGGRLGAWVADLLLYLFGLSAYLIAAFLLVRVGSAYRVLHGPARQPAPAAVPVPEVRTGAEGSRRLTRRERLAEAERLAAEPMVRFGWERWFGFLVMLLAGSALEATRLQTGGTEFPLGPGGLAGLLLGPWLHQVLGAVGGTLTLLLALALGFSLATGVSWLAVFETCGRVVEAGGRRMLRLGLRLGGIPVDGPAGSRLGQDGEAAAAPRAPNRMARLIGAWRTWRARHAVDVDALMQGTGPGAGPRGALPRPLPPRQAAFQDHVTSGQDGVALRRAGNDAPQETTVRARRAAPDALGDGVWPDTDMAPAWHDTARAAPSAGIWPHTAPALAHAGPDELDDSAHWSGAVQTPPSRLRDGGTDAVQSAEPVRMEASRMETTRMENNRTDHGSRSGGRMGGAGRVPIASADGEPDMRGARTEPEWLDTAMPGPDTGDLSATDQLTEPEEQTRQVVNPAARDAALAARSTRYSEGCHMELPALSLLDPPPEVVELVSPETIEYTSQLIEKRLADHRVTVRVVDAYPGPVITRYEIEPAPGVKGAQIVGLAKDLARGLSLVSLRVVETIPGRNLMGLELPNPRRQMVRLSEIIGSEVSIKSPSPVTVALGKDIAGNPVVADLARMPHLLVAGTTGSGKSVGINAMILSILYKADPSQVRMIMIDPKMLEMSIYEGIPHLLAPVVTDMRQAANALNWCVAEMERRYRVMSKLGVRNLAGYNTKLAEASAREELIPNPFSLTPDQPEPLHPLPIIVVVIDELADLMMVVGKKIEELIARLAQKARAAGIHLILATQRPSVDVITGLIKANIPTRIAFQVSSKVDSRTILDQMGAESLLGQGDMLFQPPGTSVPQRVHGAFVSDEEVHKVVADWKARGGEPDYIEGILEGGVSDDIDPGSAVGFGGLTQTLIDAGVEGERDALYDQAVALVLQHRKASISMVQRHLRIGYNRSARLLEQMEKSGIVSAMATNGNRDIIVPNRGDEA